MALSRGFEMARDGPDDCVFKRFGRQAPGGPVRLSRNQTVRGFCQRKLGCEGQGGELAFPNDKTIPFSVFQDEP